MRVSIATKILIPFILMVIFSLVATNIFWYFSYRQNLKQEIFEKQKTVADETIKSLENLIQEKLRLLIVYSELSDILIFAEFGERKDEVSEQLRRLSLQDKDLEEITIVNRKGKEVIKFYTKEDQFNEAPGGELTDISREAKFLIPTYRIPKEYQSDLYFSKEREPQMTLAIPLTFPKTTREYERLTKTEQRFITSVGAKPGDVLGVLTVEVNLERIFNEMVAKKIGKEGYVYFVDKDHKIFAHPDQAMVKEKLDVSNLLIIEGVSHSEHPLVITDQGKNEKEVESLMTHAHFSNWGWVGLIVQEPIRQAFSAILNLQKIAVVFSFLGIIFASLISLFISKRIVVPIKRFQGVIEGVEKGNYSVRADIKTQDEIEELANAFNQTLNQIQNTNAALEEVKTVLEIKVQARTRELKELAGSLEEKVNERTKELKEKINELERFNKVTVGRELKMVELKEEIKKLKEGSAKLSNKKEK